jgi:hypothetical protein
MIRLLGWGDETATPRAEEPGFVPRLESLEHRVVLSEGKKVKIDFAMTDPVQAGTASPAVGLVAPPADPTAAGGSVQVPGGTAGFDPVYVGIEPALLISSGKGN